MSSILSRAWRALLGAVLACALIGLAPLPAPAAEAPPGYVLGYGDALNLSLLGDDSLKLEHQPIRPDGRVSLPLLGEVQAGGLTVAALSARLTEAYARYYVAPRLVLNVASFRPLRINVLGMVNKPGTYAVSTPVHLLEALALAGGLDRERASLRDVAVLKPDGTRRQVDLAAILEGQAADALWISDGDTVRVAELGGPDWYRILPTAASVVSIVGTVLWLYFARH